MPRVHTLYDNTMNCARTPAADKLCTCSTLAVRARCAALAPLSTPHFKFTHNLPPSSLPSSHALLSRSNLPLFDHHSNPMPPLGYVCTSNDISSLGFDLSPSNSTSTSSPPPTHNASRSLTPTSTARVNPVAKVLLEGMLDPSRKSPLSLLAVCPDLLANIFNRVRQSWADSLIVGYDDVTISSWGVSSFPAMRPASDELLDKVALSLVDYVEFPPPSGVQCNMLPFILGDRASIPEEYQHYYKLVTACPVEEEQMGKVCYLTIHESRTTVAQPQRRGGLHVEGFLGVRGRCDTAPCWHPWGMGRTGRFKGGLYMASSVSASCRLWNAQVPRRPSAALRSGCDVEHLRGVLDSRVRAVKPMAGDLYWLTDATPHESLPLEAGTYRQFFRLVTSEVAVWWEKHSTRNRLGIEPACEVVTYDKFSGK